MFEVTLQYGTNRNINGTGPWLHILHYRCIVTFFVVIVMLISSSQHIYKLIISSLQSLSAVFCQMLECQVYV